MLDGSHMPASVISIMDWPSILLVSEAVQAGFGLTWSQIAHTASLRCGP